MTAAVPDPRFRDQLAEQAWGVLVAAADRELVPLHGANSWNVVAHAIVRNLLPLIAAEVEARVQAAANQRAAVVGRCGNCDASTDTLPCPFCAPGSQQRAHSLAQEVHHLRADGQHGTATRLIRTALDAAQARGRAAALASPAPAPQTGEH